MVLILLLFFGVAFAIACLFVLGAAFVISKPAVSLAGEPVAEPEPELFRSEQLSSISAWHTLLARFNFVRILRVHLAQAGLDWSVGRVTLAMLLAGSVVFAAASRVRWAPLWVVIACAWGAALVPYAVVLHTRSKRFQDFSVQFPDVLDSLGRAMRAGYPLLGALEIVSREALPPAGSEIRKVYAETDLGMPLSRALENLRDRLPLPEVDVFAAAVQLHSRTGGRLTDVLSALAESMREQVALRGEVRSLAAHGRMTGIILTCIPVIIAGLMLVVSPMYIRVLTAHPYGKNLIAAAVVCLVAAHFVIRRIVDIRI